MAMTTFSQSQYESSFSEEKTRIVATAKTQKKYTLTNNTVYTYSDQEETATQYCSAEIYDCKNLLSLDEAQSIDLSSPILDYTVVPWYLKLVYTRNSTNVTSVKASTQEIGNVRVDPGFPIRANGAVYNQSFQGLTTNFSPTEFENRIWTTGLISFAPDMTPKENSKFLAVNTTQSSASLSGEQTATPPVTSTNTKLISFQHKLYVSSTLIPADLFYNINGALASAQFMADQLNQTVPENAMMVFTEAEQIYPNTDFFVFCGGNMRRAEFDTVENNNILTPISMVPIGVLYKITYSELMAHRIVPT